MTLTERIDIAYQELADLEKAYKRTLSAQSWSTKDGDSQRSVTNVSLAELSRQIVAKKTEIANLERRLRGGSKAFVVGVRF